MARRLVAVGRFLILVASLVAISGWVASPQVAPGAGRQKVIIDTDIGDDIDDVFAVALALSSPDLEVLGITTAWGDTQLRARLVDRLLCETGTQNISVLAGIPTKSHAPLSQRRWAERFPQPEKPYPPAVDFILEQIRRYPSQITLLALAPFTNVGGLIERDPEMARKLKRIVIMGGSVYRAYNDFGYTANHHPEAEYNIASDVASARGMFGAGVPLYVMPLDSTQIKLDETRRQIIFQQSTPLTDALALLYHQWGQLTPTLFDPVAVAFAISPEICPTTKLRLEVDDKGFTRPAPGPFNAEVCLNSKSDDFFQLYMTRMLTQRLVGHCSR